MHLMSSAFLLQRCSASPSSEDIAANTLDNGLRRGLRCQLFAVVFVVHVVANPIFEADAPDVKRIPTSEMLGVTVILLTCSYDGRERDLTI
jgi:hypothetical protein